MLTKSSDDKANSGYRAAGGTPDESVGVEGAVAALAVSPRGR
jgi:hypothetical protein